VSISASTQGGGLVSAVATIGTSSSAAYLLYYSLETNTWVFDGSNVIACPLTCALVSCVCNVASSDGWIVSGGPESSKK
jgi:hypothetical protein